MFRVNYIYIVDGVYQDSFITIYMLYVTLVEIQLFIPISFFYQFTTEPLNVTRYLI